VAKQKLTDRQIAGLRAAYEAWNPHDPDSESADDLAARFGISKQTMYTYRDRWLTEDRRRRESAGRQGGEQQSGRAEEAVVFLTIELARARARIEALEVELRELRDRAEIEA